MANPATTSELTREQLILAVQEACGFKTKAEAAHALKGVCSTIAKNLLDNAQNPGHRIRVPELGIIQVAATKERTGRNPQDGTTFPIPAGTALKMKFTKELRDSGKGTK